MADDIEVHVDLASGVRRVGTLRRHARRGGEATTFEYHDDWVDGADAFSLEPALKLGRGLYAPDAGRAIFGSLGDSAPDTWGRRLMQRRERRAAEREGRAVRTLMEADYLLGVADVSRLGALRFRMVGEEAFRTAGASGVPGLIALGDLMAVTERILRDEETDEDLQMIFAPGSSLGGARPKASVLDQHGRLSIAKFPKENDEYSVERWEAIALALAKRAQIDVPDHELVDVAGRPVLLSRRFDREGGARVPFLSAMSMLGLENGKPASYPELVDALTQHGADAAQDAAQLYRRMAFNVLVSNVDDHLRNHGFLWDGKNGWKLSPAYDLNPTPTDLRQRVLTTAISFDDAACDVDLVLSVADFFGLGHGDASSIVRDVAEATKDWRAVAKKCGASSAEIALMQSAFEHDDLTRALALSKV